MNTVKVSKWSMLVFALMVGCLLCLAGCSSDSAKDEFTPSIVSDQEMVLASSGEIDCADFIKDTSAGMTFDENNTECCALVRFPCRIDQEFAQEHTMDSLKLAIEGDQVFLGSDEVAPSQVAQEGSEAIMGQTVAKALTYEGDASGFKCWLTVSVPTSAEEVKGLMEGKEGTTRDLVRSAVESLKGATLSLQAEDGSKVIGEYTFVSNV